MQPVDAGRTDDGAVRALREWVARQLEDSRRSALTFAALAAFAAVIVSGLTFLILWMLIHYPAMLLSLRAERATTTAAIAAGIVILLYAWQFLRPPDRLRPVTLPERGAEPVVLYTPNLTFTGVLTLHPGAISNAPRLLADLLLTGPRLAAFGISELGRRGRLAGVTDGQIDGFARLLAMLRRAGRRVDIEMLMGTPDRKTWAEGLALLPEFDDGVLYLDGPPPALAISSDLAQELTEAGV